MRKTNRALYRSTLQQQAINAILQSFTREVAFLYLGEHLKLGDRGNSLLLDLIKTKELKEVKFADCLLKNDDLTQIRNLLWEKTDKLIFRDNTDVGVEGCVLIKHLVTQRPVKVFSMWDCDVGPSQLSCLIQGLIAMKGDVIEEVNLRGSHMSTECCILLKQLLSAKRIKKLDLGHCRITNDQLIYLADGLEAMTGTMEVLNLRGNLIMRSEVDTFKVATKFKVIEVSYRSNHRI
nr:uncharacterized protein LOC100177463 [Ciona intestinalis]|eukprot:XP_026695152.1 uncharacterized protein LOC100177463 [Ciona intestinalis]